MAATQTAITESPRQDAPDSIGGLLELSQDDLDRLFSGGSPEVIPEGRGKGGVILKPGTGIAKVLNAVLTAIFWRGKQFAPATHDLKNLISPLAIPGIRATVYKDVSWFDGHECIVLDYSRTSKVAGWIRDEIREVSPGLYLGVVFGVGRVFGGRKRIAGFALTFGDRRPGA